jgi:hypothetical protein
MGPGSTHPKHGRTIELKNEESEKSEENDRGAEPQSHRAAEMQKNAWMHGCMDA